ncbi:MAG: hypothetical protein ABI972_30590, partial [Acidobacteriota bacterium]
MKKPAALVVMIGLLGTACLKKQQESDGGEIRGTPVAGGTVVAGSAGGGTPGISGGTPGASGGFAAPATQSPQQPYSPPGDQPPVQPGSAPVPARRVPEGYQVTEMPGGQGRILRASFSGNARSAQTTLQG